MGNKTNRSDASLLLADLGWTRERLAHIIPCTLGQVSKYLTGYRGLTQKSKTRLLREYGDDAWELIDACDAARLVYTSTGTRLRVVVSGGESYPMGRDAPRPRLTGAARRAEKEILERVAPMGDALPDDDASYTIGEWKDKFGEPGSGADIHGRWITSNGAVFATEPCYLDESHIFARGGEAS